MSPLLKWYLPWPCRTPFTKSPSYTSPVVNSRHAKPVNVGDTTPPQSAEAFGVVGSAAAAAVVGLAAVGTTIVGKSWPCENCAAMNSKGLLGFSFTTIWSTRCMKGNTPMLSKYACDSLAVIMPLVGETDGDACPESPASAAVTSPMVARWSKLSAPPTTTSQAMPVSLLSASLYRCGTSADLGGTMQIEPLPTFAKTSTFNSPRAKSSAVKRNALPEDAGACLRIAPAFTETMAPSGMLAVDTSRTCIDCKVIVRAAMLRVRGSASP
mmetsp:Transcript_54974/g.108571  ORF Transcript_54974/g.108571 Transcript_54974/m.108571 type:complete len:268 (+) Transcript_54974:186-989(+)